VKETALQTWSVRKRGRRRCSRGQSKDSLQAPRGENTIVVWVVLLHPMEVHSGADIHTVTHGRPHTSKSPPEGFYPMERTHSGAVLEELQPMGGTPCPNKYSV